MKKNHYLPLMFAMGFYVLLVLSTMGTMLAIDLSRAYQHQSYAEFWASHGISELPRNRAMVADYAEKFDNYMRENFGFRESYFDVMAKVYGLFGIVPTKYEIVRGRDNWFFTKANHSLIGYTPRFYLSDAEVAQWRTYIEAKRRWAASMNAHYFFMMAPSSNTVYHDKLPLLDGVDVMQSQMTQIFASIQQPPDAPFMIDARTALLQARQESPHNLYYKTDTHWNFLGAYRAFSVLMTAVHRAFPEIQVDHYDASRFVVTDRLAMDYISRFSAFEQLHDTEVKLADMPACSTVEQFIPLPNPYHLGGMREPLKTICPSAQPLKVLVFHDSFFKYLQPMLSAQFQEVSYIWVYQNSDEVSQYYAELLKPDIIIEEIAERYTGVSRSTTQGGQP